MSFKLFILWIALNAAPANITSFIFTSPEKQSVEYARQPDTGWKAVTADQRAGPTIYVSGTELTIVSVEGKKMSFPVANAMGLEKEIAWPTVDSIPFGQAVIKIQRQEDGLNLLLDSAEIPVTNKNQQTYTVRWKSKIN